MVFGTKSKTNLLTTHPDIQKVANKVISITIVDFGISEGHRPIKKQQEYYAIGRTTELDKDPITKVDGINILGKHNEVPAKAIDIFAWHSDPAIRKKIAYDPVHLAYIYGLFDAVSKEMYAKGEISHLIRWGGNWDKDGVLLYDQEFDDNPHLELYKP